MESRAQGEELEVEVSWKEDNDRGDRITELEDFGIQN